MAANSSSRGIASLGKRFAHQIRTNSLPSLSSARRAAHSSSYDKNVDDAARPSLAGHEELSQPLSDKYWAPDPHTGVFGPASSPSNGSGGQAISAPADCTGEGSVERQVWFRPTSLEDLEKPSMH